MGQVYRCQGLLLYSGRKATGVSFLSSTQMAYLHMSRRTIAPQDPVLQMDMLPYSSMVK